MRVVLPVLVAEASSGTGSISVALDPAAAAGAVAVLGVSGASVRVQATIAGVGVYDTTKSTGSDPPFRTILTFEDLPHSAAAHIVVTITGAEAGAAVSLENIIAGNVIQLGTTETGPAIGITDFSRRDTDAFGVTTVVERGWSKKLSLQFEVATTAVDQVERQLAALRAKAALWIADDSLDSLMVYGFSKDFSIDLAASATSYCSLTIEGLVITPIHAPGDETVYLGTDAGAFLLTEGGISLVDEGFGSGDPAPSTAGSTLKVIRPVPVTDGSLDSSSVAENDYAEWSVGATYAAGARVIKAATHRIYESVIGANVGHDPAGLGSTQWLDVGATNRWAMFDQALGSATSAAGTIAVTISPDATTDAVAILDAVAATVRVQATGYDQTKSAAVGGVMLPSLLFFDLPANAGDLTVTITGSGTVSVGSFIIGKAAGLGITEGGPSIGITDFSRKDTDDFGVTTIVERGWAKRMTLRALVDSALVDSVLAQVASLRATPSLWVGQDGVDSLTIYGFFKDFSIQVSENISIAALTIEGLSTAAPLVPATTKWEDITDPNGTKPEDNATVGAPEGTHVAGTPVEDVADATAAANAGLNGDGTVKDGKVDTPALMPGSVTDRSFEVLNMAGASVGTDDDNVWRDFATGGNTLDAFVTTPDLDSAYDVEILVNIIGRRTGGDNDHVSLRVLRHDEAVCGPAEYTDLIFEGGGNQAMMFQFYDQAPASGTNTYRLQSKNLTGHPAWQYGTINVKLFKR